MSKGLCQNLELQLQYRRFDGNKKKSYRSGYFCHSTSTPLDILFAVVEGRDTGDRIIYFYCYAGFSL